MIRNQLVNYIYNGFLVPVLAPALHKVSGWLLESFICITNGWKLRQVNMV